MPQLAPTQADADVAPIAGIGMKRLRPLGSQDDPIPDTIPLSNAEKIRKEQLERIVGEGLAKFLEVGIALAELRTKRLYRTHFATFEQYVRSRFHLHRSAVDGVIRAAQTAQVLIDSGLQLPPDTTPTSLRTIGGMPGEELKVACWQLAQTLSPARAPTQPLVSRLCRIVRNAIEMTEDDQEENEADEQPRPGVGWRGPNGRRSIESPSREFPFTRPLVRLSNWQGFSVEIVLSSVTASSKASTLYRACAIMRTRCEELQSRLAVAYPEVADA